MDLIKILQAFEKGEKIQKKLKMEGEKWEDVEPKHLWNTASFDYRVKPEHDTVIYPYTRQELIAKMEEKGFELVFGFGDEISFRIVDVLNNRVKLKSLVQMSLLQESCFFFPIEELVNFRWRKDKTPCGWDSAEYEVVDEPVIHQGVRWGTERVVRRKKK